MELNKFEFYTSCCLRLYEEDFNEVDIIFLINRLQNNGFDRIACYKHIKDGAKTHYHLLLIGKQFRPSKIYKMDIQPHWCSTVDNRKAMYFYIAYHTGKEEEDKTNGHKIEKVFDNINYQYCPVKGKRYELKNFFIEVDEIINKYPRISKRELLYKLMEENISYMGLYLKHQRFIEDMYNFACYTEVDKRVTIHEDDEE